MAIDLHLHSTCSDGRLTPKELVLRAAKLKLKTIAVSDHDSGVGALKAMRYGKRYGVQIVPAVEVSALYKGKVIHLLGYFVDLKDRAFQKKLDELRRDRIGRAVKILERVNALAKKRGMPPVNPKEFLKWVGKKEMIMRGDIAEFLLRKGFGKSHNEVFLDWLEETNVPVRGLPVNRAISLIHQAGGVAVLAHPNSPSLGLGQLVSKLKDQQAVIARFVQYGLDGIEVQTPKTEKNAVPYYRSLVKKFSLVSTMGSDYHGEHIPGQGRLGDVRASDKIVADLYKRSRRYH